jgi:flagellar basal body-associated protein FliL
MAAPDASAAAPTAPSRLSRIAGIFRGERLLAACLAVVVVGGMVVATIFVLGDKPSGVTVQLGGPLVYQPLPEIIADLKPSARRSHHIKLAIVMQLPAQQIGLVTSKETEIIAAVQMRLRELTVADVDGAAGADRLRVLVLDAVNGAIAPAQARTVLFTQLIVD